MASSQKIEVVLVGDDRQLQAALGRSAKSVEGFAGKMNKAGKQITSAGHSLTRNLTLPLGILGAVAVKTAADFDSSLSKIQGLVGANTQQMNQYRESILKLAPAVAQGPTALADALYFVTSSGFKGAQALDILTQSAKASTAGLGDTKTVADLVTSAMTAYGSKTLSASHAVDILVAATKAGKGDPQQFAQALQLNVAAANTLGISFDQLAAATAALSTINSNVAEDATQLSGIMTALIKPSAGAQTELHKLGLSAAELRTEVRDKGLLTTLLDLKNRTNDNIDALGKLFPNVRGLRGFLTLVGKAAQKNVSIFDQVANSTGDMNKAFQTALTKDPTAQFEKLKAQLQVTAIVLGQQLIPILLSFAGVLVTITGAFTSLSPEMQHVVLLAGGFLFILGPMLTLIANLAVAIGFLANGFKVLAGAELAAEAGIAPYIAAAVILAAVVGGLGYALLTMGDGTTRVARAMDDATGATKGLTSAFKAQKDAIQGVKQAHHDVTQAALNVKTTQERVNGLVKDGKKGTDEYKQALLDQKQAEIDLTAAQGRNADATEKERQAHKKAWGEVQTLRDNLNNLKGTVDQATAATERQRNSIALGHRGMQRFGAATDVTQRAVAEYADKMAKASVQSEQTANKLDKLSPKAAAAARNFARFESAASGLAAALGRIPSTVEVDLFIKTTKQLTTIESNRLKRAAGGPVTGGTTYLVGERGPELFTPNSSGKITPNSQISGGGGGITLSFPNALIVDGKSVKHAVSLLLPEINRAQARRA